MLIETSRYIINTDHIVYIEQTGSLPTIHFANGESITLGHYEFEYLMSQWNPKIHKKTDTNQITREELLTETP